MAILVTGATGTLGRHVVTRLDRADARVLSRRADVSVPGATVVRGDLATGDGLDAAIDGVDTVLHLAGNPRAGDAELARTLAAAAVRAGGPHVVLISVVGADAIPQRGRVDRTVFGYYGEQAAVERVLQDSGLPLTIQRATQFHELLLAAVRGLAKLPVALVPPLRFQPVAADDVAARLVALAAAPPGGRVADLRGPEELSLREMLAAYLDATGRRRRPVVPLRLPGDAFRAYAAGANLAGPDAGRGTQTWRAFLAT